MSNILYQWTLSLNPFCFCETEYLHFNTRVLGNSAISPFLGGIWSHMTYDMTLSHATWLLHVRQAPSMSEVTDFIWDTWSIWYKETCISSHMTWLFDVRGITDSSLKPLRVCHDLHWYQAPPCRDVSTRDIDITNGMSTSHTIYITCVTNCMSMSHLETLMSMSHL